MALEAMADDFIKIGGDKFYHPRGTTAADIMRDNHISAQLDIDPQYVNYICKAIRRDSRYYWSQEILEHLGVMGLDWNTVTDEKIKELALSLARQAG